MNEKHYVIQWKIGPSAKWITLAPKYSTLEAARAIMEKKKKAGLSCEQFRIAESYVTIRYKTVKD